MGSFVGTLLAFVLALGGLVCLLGEFWITGCVLLAGAGASLRVAFFYFSTGA